MQELVVPRCFLRAKAIGLMPMIDQGEADDEIRRLFEDYKKNENKEVAVNYFVPSEDAYEAIQHSMSELQLLLVGNQAQEGMLMDQVTMQKNSTAFEVRYIASSCSLLVIARGNQAIREIQLNFDDCVYPYEAGFPLEIGWHGSSRRSH